jgi:hypothetical protein
MFYMTGAVQLTKPNDAVQTSKLENLVLRNTIGRVQNLAKAIIYLLTTILQLIKIPIKFAACLISLNKINLTKDELRQDIKYAFKMFIQFIDSAFSTIKTPSQKEYYYESILYASQLCLNSLKGNYLDINSSILAGSKKSPGPMFTPASSPFGENNKTGPLVGYPPTLLRHF